MLEILVTMVLLSWFLAKKWSDYIFKRSSVIEEQSTPNESATAHVLGEVALQQNEQASLDANGVGSRSLTGNVTIISDSTEEMSGNSNDTRNDDSPGMKNCFGFSQLFKKKKQ